ARSNATVVHEPRDAVRAVAPAQTCPVDQLGRRFYAVLRNATDVGQILMEQIENGTARDGLGIAMHVVGTGDPGIPSAKIAHVPVVAGAPVESGNVQETASERAPVFQPAYAGSLGEGGRGADVGQGGRDHGLERRTARGIGVCRYRATEIAG